MATHRPFFRTKVSSIFILFVILALLLAGCGALAPKSPAVVTPLLSTPTTPLVGLDTPTLELPSATPELLLDTDTAVAPSPTVELPTDTETPTPVLPSPTIQPTDTSQPQTGTFSFSPGTTAGLVTGTVQAGQVVTYTLSAQQGQPLTLIIGSANKDVVLGVMDPNGNILLNPSARRTAFQMPLPSSGLYTIRVVGGATTEDYSLTAKIPQLVNFASGATSATLNGTTVNGYLYSYALACGAGQTLSASLNVPSSTAVIDIYGVSSGTTFLYASAGTNTWTGILPRSEDYVIEVVPVNGVVTDYALTVSVTGTVANFSSGGGNIVFTPGTTAASINGTIQPGQVVTYTVQANQHQPMILLVDSPKRDVTLGVLLPDGTTLLTQAMKWSHWQSNLPTTGQYTIQVVGGKTAENYTLTVKIAQLVYFRKGSRTVTLHGNTYNGYVISYAFQATAGEILTATLSTPATKAFLDIFGIETGSLLNFSAHATSKSIKLPKTQTYVVEVVPRGGYLVSFTLTVTIP